jgi:nucleoside-diphosphate-sugar epimerase
MNINVLITGATGFVGRELCSELGKRGAQIKVAVRTPQVFDSAVEAVLVGAIDGATAWEYALKDVDLIIHLAARVHVMKDASANPLDEFRKVNVEGSAHLARCAAKVGVKRFVYVSSIKVNGEETAYANQFLESDLPSPQDPYGCSKWEAEQALHRVAAETGLEVVIVRPPLVYGAGVKGNFAQMLKILANCIPLPLASVRNQRSLVYIENLVDALIVCATHPAAAGQTFLVSDGEDISTSDLLSQLGSAMGRPARLFPCSPTLLKLSGQMLGKSEQIERLLGSLRVDSGKIRRELNWHPPCTLQEGLRKTGESIAAKLKNTLE